MIKRESKKSIICGFNTHQNCLQTMEERVQSVNYCTINIKSRGLSCTDSDCTLTIHFKITNYTKKSEDTSLCQHKVMSVLS